MLHVTGNLVPLLQNVKYGHFQNIFGLMSGLVIDYELMEQYLNSVEPDFSVSFSKYWTFDKV